MSVEGMSAADFPADDRSDALPGWRWPNGGGLAVWVVPNIEVFDPRFAVRAGGPALDTLGLAERQYGNRVGLGRIRGLLSTYEITPTAAVNSAVAEARPALVRDLVDDGWELMGHGRFNNRQMTTYPADEERAAIADCLSTLEEASGRRPRGWLSPGLQETSQTLSHLASEGVDYVADWVNDDRPDTMTLPGSQQILSLPYSVQTNDKAAYDRHGLTPELFRDLVKRQFDLLHRESLSSPVVMALALHPYLSGVPHRVAALDELLRHMRAQDDVWFATGGSIVDAWEASRAPR